MRLILNGKKSELARPAVAAVRQVADLEVRVTWESGDLHRLVLEAAREQC